MIALSCSTRGLPGPLQNVLPRIRSAGYGFVEVWRPEGENAASPPARSAEALRCLLEENGLTLSGMALPPLPAVGAADRRWHVEHIQRHMLLARDLGLRALQLTSGDRKTQSVADFARDVRAILSACEPLGMELHLANLRGSRLEQLADFELLLVEVTGPNLGLLADMGEFHASAVNPADAVRSLAARLSGVRVGDRIGRRPVPLGSGESNLAWAIETLIGCGYRNCITIDPRRKDGDPFSDLASDRVWLERLLAGLWPE